MHGAHAKVKCKGPKNATGPVKKTVLKTLCCLGSSILFKCSLIKKYLLPSDVLCCQQQSLFQMPTPDLGVTHEAFCTCGLREFCDSFNEVTPWYQLGMSWQVRVHGHIPLTVCHCRMSDNIQQGHPLQNHVLEAPDVVDSWWFFTWLSTATSSHLSGNKRISCESQVHKKKKKTRTTGWQVTLEQLQLQHTPEVVVWTWQMAVYYFTLCSFKGNSIFPRAENRTELNRSCLPWWPAAAAAYVKCYVVDDVFFTPDAFVTGACTTIGTHMLGPQSSLLVSSQGSGAPDVQYACVHLLCFFTSFISRGGLRWCAEYSIYIIYLAAF